MLVNMNCLLQTAKKDKKAIPAFNVYNFETVRAVLKASRRQHSPVIIAFGEKYMSYAPIEVIASIVKKMALNSDVPAVLHLDHAKKLDSIVKAIQCGFTSVMYDGSQLELHENIESTKKVVEFAHSAGISVEGELGYMNPEDAASDSGKVIKSGYTDPEKAAEYVNSTGLDALAVAVGNAHGIYKGTPNLNFLALQKINEASAVPLVLHGCSGIPDDMIKKAVKLGVCKINVNTELSTSAVKAVRTFLDSNPENSLKFEKVLAFAENEITDKAGHYIELLK